MHLDTHVVVWLFAGSVDVFPPTVRALLDSEPLSVSPMVSLELDLLHEIGRTGRPAITVLAELQRTIGLTISAATFADVVSAAADLHWTRDPFDRLISAQAIAENQQLLTRDRRIRANLSVARWDE
ncbi:MAG TPA: PIN domain-containing protein [Nakamurella sp.]